MARQVCFMIMPFGTKATQVSGGGGPAKVDFDALWDKALAPLIRDDLGYEPVRADKDLGASIIKEMIERLTLADIVVADVTLPNANVYYEIGVRHAAREKGCVLVAAEWSSQVFDLEQMRQLRYPLPEGSITDQTANAIRKSLKNGIGALVEGKSPIFATVPGFPNRLDPKSADSFRAFVEAVSDFQSKVRAVREAGVGERRNKALALRAEYADLRNLLPAVSLELMLLLRDYVGWAETLEFLDGLPPATGQLPVFQEQRCLAVSKTGSPEDAVGKLHELIRMSGESSERRGLLGGRYKRLFDESTHPADKLRFLELAIENYELGMYLDLNDYYPTSNLARLYRLRKDDGDEDRARMAAAVTIAACERAKKIGAADEWLNPTLLGAAFDAADVTKARQLYREIARDGHAAWKLESTIRDLARSVEVASGDMQASLRAVLDDLKALLD